MAYIPKYRVDILPRHYKKIKNFFFFKTILNASQQTNLMTYGLQ